MFIHFGQEFYGKVDRVPGLFTSKPSSYFCSMPLIPLESYVLLENTPANGVSANRSG